MEMARAERRLTGCEACAKVSPASHPARTAVEEMKTGLRATFPSHFNDGIDVAMDDVRMARAAPSHFLSLKKPEKIGGGGIEKFAKI